MKCIRCGTDNKLKERTENAGKCKTCKHPFTFDPKAGQATPVTSLFDPKLSAKITFTDMFFANSLKAVSADNTLFFTSRQLYYFFNSRRDDRKGMFKTAGCALLLAAIFIFVILVNMAGLTICIAPAILLAVVAVALFIPAVRRRLLAYRPKKITVDSHLLNQWLDMWKRANGPVTKLLPPPATERKPAKINPDVQAYSFDRLIVCERESVAQFLIANNFHFEHNCAVLAIDGYPHNLFDTVMRMLRRNPALKVYALHNATPSGVHLVHRLMTDPKWFKESSGVTVYDLGLLPRQVMNRRMFIEQSEGMAEQARKGMAPEVRNSLRPDEIKWLEEGYHVDLESIPPKQLLRVLTLGIAKSRDPQADDTLVPVYGGYSDGGGGIYASDSFG